MDFLFNWIYRKFTMRTMGHHKLDLYPFYQAIHLLNLIVLFKLSDIDETPTVRLK